MGLQMAFDLADQHIPTWIVSLEMDAESLLERLFCNVMEVDNIELLTGKFKTNEQYRSKWKSFCKMIEDLPLLITSGIGKTVAELVEALDILNPKPKCVVIDYVQAVKSTGAYGKEREILNEYIRHFREICIKNEIAGVLCSQINRQVASGEHTPALWALKGTGVLEEHADTVMLLHYDHFYSQKEEGINDFLIIIAKQRNGRTGQHRCLFLPQFCKFKEITEMSLDEAEKEFNNGR